MPANLEARPDGAFLIEEIRRLHVALQYRGSEK